MEAKVAELPLADRIWAWLETNQKQALWCVAALVGAGVVVGFFIWNHGQNEDAASMALSSVAAPQFVGGLRVDSPEAYLKLAAKYPGSGAATRASLMAAAAYFTEGKYPEAKAQFERFTREHGDSPYVGQALLGIAACLDVQGNSAEAAAAYKNLIDRHPSESYIPQAKFALARLYEAQNKPELARNLYEEVETTDHYGYLGSEAGMRLEDLRTKYPSLAPSTPPAGPQFKFEKK
ncbi:MAG TPA: tetratricopeptide repeat protein [Candidatus Binatia bacterium]|jgi:predicted negative regulator of RcsB-dependent stress response|nr:tetratricopeptide repeat protein [Candidatus Binatia bacterium]